MGDRKNVHREQKFNYPGGVSSRDPPYGMVTTPTQHCTAHMKTAMIVEFKCSYHKKKKKRYVRYHLRSMAGFSHSTMYACSKHQIYTVYAFINY